MSILLSCQSISKSYGNRVLFQEISLGIEDGEGVGLVGPNGSGKSTLLRILAQMEKPDSGVVSLRRLARLAYVPQEEEFPAGATVTELLLEALEESDDYEQHAQVSVLLSKAGFARGDQAVETLSGGWKKRLSIARALLRHPDLLLLDEPTNHLDLDGILWLEKILASASFAYLLVSHDRYLLEDLATRVVELNRAYPEGYFSVEGSYSDFLLRREEFLAAQAHQEVALAAQVRREIEWLKRGARARTTKAQGRIREANQKIGDLSELKVRNSQDRTITIEFDATRRKSKELLVAKDLEKSLGGRRLFSKLSISLGPGARLGLLGPNGSGKTTLLRVLSGDLPPDHGSVKPAANLRIVYFEQGRQSLNREESLRDALGQGMETVHFAGRPIHVAGWARRFLFRPEQLVMSVGSLSGGEQARVLLAQLMLKPADLLILDEPTNDLDIPSLEVLEESLLEFPGAILLVTHDRFMLDRVSTQLLALDGRGRATFFADYSQWERQQPAAPEARPKPAAPASRPAAPPPSVGLTPAEKREWNEIETRILSAEKTVQTLTRKTEDPAVQADHVQLREAFEALDAAHRRVEELYARWEELDRKRTEDSGIVE